ncbi:MAG: Uma2 family endonuclease [Phototrophicales bacterium]|nr:Uma2 family endonuclease [Phototrophicales bacterium]
MLTDRPQIDLREGMSLDEFLRQSNDQPFELINGRRIDKMPPGLPHNVILRAIFRLLDPFVMQHDLGEAFSENAFITEERTDWVRGSRIPDISFYRKARIQHIMNAMPAVIPIVPDLIMEILSPTDNLLDVQDRILFDFDNGVKQIWLIDPERRGALVYIPDANRPQRFGEDGVLSAPDILPNFELALNKIWA